MTNTTTLPVATEWTFEVESHALVVGDVSDADTLARRFYTAPRGGYAPFNGPGLVDVFHFGGMVLSVPPGTYRVNVENSSQSGANGFTISFTKLGDLPDNIVQSEEERWT